MVLKNIQSKLLGLFATRQEQQESIVSLDAFKDSEPDNRPWPDIFKNMKYAQPSQGMLASPPERKR